MNTYEKALLRLSDMKRRKDSRANTLIYSVKRILGLNFSAQQEYRLQKIGRL
jgi:hypothetical protein